MRKGERLCDQATQRKSSQMAFGDAKLIPDANNVGGKIIEAATSDDRAGIAMTAEIKADHREAGIQTRRDFVP
jgi:hypothetical protein